MKYMVNQIVNGVSSDTNIISVCEKAHAVNMLGLSHPNVHRRGTQSFMREAFCIFAPTRPLPLPFSVFLCVSATSVFNLFLCF
jgi:hypothetical protein